MKIFRTWTFRWWEMALLKLGLIAFGLLLGIHLQSYLEGLLWLWWVIFAISGAYFVGRFVQESESPPKEPTPITPVEPQVVEQVKDDTGKGV